MSYDKAYMTKTEPDPLYLRVDVINEWPFRIAVGLRMGLDQCWSHRRQRGEMNVQDGHKIFVCVHTCKRAQDWSLRYHITNDIISRAFTKSKVSRTRETREHTGLIRADGK